MSGGPADGRNGAEGGCQAARKKILRYLSDMDRSEGELREKLLRAGFDEDETNDAIEYARSYGYVDDRRFAGTYIRCQRERKSRMEITFALREKHVPAEIAEEAFAEAEPYDETPLILRLIEKRLGNDRTPSYDELRKCRAYLYRRGFSVEDITSALMKAGLT